MADFHGQRGVWMTYERGNYGDQALTVADTPQEAILDARDHGTHDTKIAFWPFNMTFEDAVKKWESERDSGE